MNEGRKFFGMSNKQVGILAGLAGMLLLVVCIGGWYVLAGMNRGFSGPATELPVATATSTPLVLPTLTATVPPTAMPYEQVIPAGWKQFQSELVEIWMPDNYRLSNDKIRNDVSTPAIFEMLITEVPSKSDIYVTRVGVSYEPLTGNSLDEFLDAKLREIPGQARVVDRRTVYVNSVEARRILMEAHIDNVDDNSLTYVFLDGSTVWYVEYAAQINEFYELLPMFEQSILTFRIVR